MALQGASEKWAGKFYDKGGAVYNVIHPDFGADNSGAVSIRPALTAIHDALVAAGGGYVKWPKGTYKIGNGWEETGVNSGFFWITADNTVWDFSEATIIGCVLIGNSATPSVQPRNVFVLRGTFAPDTTNATPPGGRYLVTSNACGIVSGYNCFFRDIRVVAGQYTRAFSMQTDNTYTGGGGVPIQRCGVSGLTIEKAVGMGTPVDGLDVTSAGASGLIKDCKIKNVQVAAGFYRGAVCSAGGSSWSIDNLTLDDISVDGSIDRGFVLNFLKDAHIGTLRSTDSGWTGFDISQCSGQIDALIARPVSTMSPTSPPTGSGFANNTNFGVALNDATSEASSEELLISRVTIKKTGSGVFYQGLISTKHDVHYADVYIRGTTANAITGGAYTQSFRRVRLRECGALPAFTNVKESWGDVMEYDATNLNYHTISTYELLSSEQTALAFITANRANNNGLSSRIRAFTAGSGNADLVLETATVAGFKTDQLVLKSTGEIVAANAFVDKQATLTYGTTVNTDCRLGNSFLVTATNGTAFTMAAPTNPSTGQIIEYEFLNSSGGAMGAVTWNAAFKLAGALTNPGNGNRRVIGFRYNGTNWIERYRSPADIA